MTQQYYDLLTMEEYWNSIADMYKQQHMWALIVARAQAQLKNNLLSPTAFLINPTIILQSMLYDKISTYEELSSYTLSESKWKVEAVDDLPCIAGKPVWDRLNGEEIILYKAFSKYLDMTSRNIHDLAKREGVKIRTLETISKIWNWKFRAKLYDMNEERVIELSRHRLVATMRNKHQETAHNLFEKCTEYLLDKMDQLDPKDLIPLMKEAVKLERLSLGLSPDKVSEGEAAAPILNVNLHNSGTSALMSPSEAIKQDITPENKEAISDDLARVLAVLEKVGGVNAIIDVEQEDMTTEEAATADRIKELALEEESIRKKAEIAKRAEEGK